MVTIRLVVLAVVSSLLAPVTAFAANDFFIFKAAVTLPVSTVISQPSAPTDLFAARKLTSNDLINLALGRALGTKVDKNTEILAVAFSYHENAQLSKLIVFDPSQNGVAQVKATVAHVTSIDLLQGYKSNGEAGYAAGTATFDATQPAGPNGFLTSTLHGSGAGGGPFGFGQPEKGSGKAVLTGRLQFNVNGTLFDGIVLNGKAKASGKVLGVYSE